MHATVDRIGAEHFDDGADRQAYFAHGQCRIEERVLCAQIHVIETLRRKRRRGYAIERYRSAHLHAIGDADTATEHRNVALRHSVEPPEASPDADRAVAFPERTGIIEPGAELWIGRERRRRSRRGRGRISGRTAGLRTAVA